MNNCDNNDFERSSTGLQSQDDNPYPQHHETVSQDKSMLSKKTAALVLGISIAVSTVFGFGGGLLAGNLDILSDTSTAVNDLPVMYRSVSTASGTETTAGNHLSVIDIASLAANSVIEISTETVAGNTRRGQFVAEGAGSGVIITQDGYIVTNNHVVEGTSKVNVRLRNGESYTATLVGTDSKTDIAVLKIDATGLQPAVFGDSDTLAVGELAVAIGNPLGELGGTVTDGIISSLDREIQLDGATMNLLQTNAAINPGNSGGGLFNGSGELIGIVVAKSAGSDIEGLGFAIPINDVKTVIEQLVSNGYVQGRIYLGVSLIDITDAQTAMLYRLQQLGVYVQEVYQNSPAQRKGIQPGDCLVSINGTDINSSADLIKELDSYKVGDYVTFIINRDGQNLSVSLQLAEQNGASNNLNKEESSTLY